MHSINNSFGQCDVRGQVLWIHDKGRPMFLPNVRLQVTLLFACMGTKRAMKLGHLAAFYSKVEEHVFPLSILFPTNRTGPRVAM